MQDVVGGGGLHCRHEAFGHAPYPDLQFMRARDCPLRVARRLESDSSRPIESSRDPIERQHSAHLISGWTGERKFPASILTLPMSDMGLNAPVISVRLPGQQRSSAMVRCWAIEVARGRALGRGSRAYHRGKARRPMTAPRGLLQIAWRSGCRSGERPRPAKEPKPRPVPPIGLAHEHRKAYTGPVNDGSENVAHALS